MSRLACETVLTAATVSGVALASPKNDKHESFYVHSLYYYSLIYKSQSMIHHIHKCAHKLHGSYGNHIQVFLVLKQCVDVLTRLLIHKVLLLRLCMHLIRLSVLLSSITLSGKCPIPNLVYVSWFCLCIS